MKTNEVSSEKLFHLGEKWTFKRVFRISLKVALLYAFLSAIWILIFDAKPEIVWKIKMTEKWTETITLPWNSWFNILPNFTGIVLFGIFAFLIAKILEGKVTKEDLLAGLGVGLLAGLGVGLLAGLLAGLGVGLVVGLLAGLGVGLVVGLVVGLLAGLGVGLVVGLLAGLGVGLVAGLVVGLVAGLVVGLVAGLFWLIKQLFSAKLWISIWKWFVK